MKFSPYILAKPSLCEEEMRVEREDGFHGLGGEEDTKRAAVCVGKKRGKSE
jgi:hypothetical protein